MHIFSIIFHRKRKNVLLFTPTHPRSTNDSKQGSENREVLIKREIERIENICARRNIRSTVSMSNNQMFCSKGKWFPLTRIACNTQCVAKDQKELWNFPSRINIRQKHVAEMFWMFPSPLSEPVEFEECFKSWCARQGWFKSL